MRNLPKGSELNEKPTERPVVSVMKAVGKAVLNPKKKKPKTKPKSKTPKEGSPEEEAMESKDFESNED